MEMRGRSFKDWEKFNKDKKIQQDWRFPSDGLNKLEDFLVGNHNGNDNKLEKDVRDRFNN